MLGRTTAAIAVLAALAVTSGCSQTQGGPAGFVSGAGTVTVVPAGEREPAPPISGELLDGGRLDLADYDGKVVVLNVWGSWCGPCRSEAPELAEAASELPGAQFVGVNVRDHGQQARARAFVERYGVPYPSIYDPDGSTLLGLRPRASAIPSTVVIDAEGDVAATVLGEVTRSTLVGLVEDVEAGSVDG
jgi:thiol-disulfide isomerase/thioredoxin